MKQLHEVLAEATDEQILGWFEDVKQGRWPDGMPMTREALSTLWCKLQVRALAVPPKKKSGK